MSENIVEGSLQYSKGEFAIVCARFNGFIVESLLAGALSIRSSVAVWQLVISP